MSETITIVKNQNGAKYLRCSSLEFRYIYKIENFQSTNVVTFSSPIFAPKEFEDRKWQLEFFKNNNIISLNCKDTNQKKEYLYRWTCGILNSAGENVNVTPLVGKLWIAETTPYVTENISFLNGLKNNCSDILPNGHLTIVSDILMIENFQESSEMLIADVSTFFNSKQFSDVTLEVEGKQIPAHKLVLSTQSSVFAAMLDIKMSESESGIVKIKDCSHEVVQEMLTFIYTNKSPNLDKMAADLWEAADKYNLKDLKKKCEYALSANLTMKTAISTLIVADRNRVDELKIKALNLIKCKALAITKTNEWMELMQSYPHLINEIVVHNAS